VTIAPSLIRWVRAATPASSVYASSVGSVSGPTFGIWWSWSMTQNESNPASSAAMAVSAIRSNIRSFETSLKVKLGIWSPKLGTAISSLQRLWFRLGADDPGRGDREDPGGQGWPAGHRAA